MHAMGFRTSSSFQREVLRRFQSRWRAISSLLSWIFVSLRQTFLRCTTHTRGLLLTSSRISKLGSHTCLRQCVHKIQHVLEWFTSNWPVLHCAIYSCSLVDQTQPASLHHVSNSTGLKAQHRGPDICFNSCMTGSTSIFRAN